MLLGENGLLKNAKVISQNNLAQTIKEQAKLAIAEVQIQMTNSEVSSMKEYVKLAGKDGIVVSNNGYIYEKNGKIFYVNSEYMLEYVLDENGNLLVSDDSIVEKKNVWEINYQFGDAMNIENYGKVVVNYNSAQSATWKLFYSDKNYIYLIADYPISGKQLPTILNSILDVNVTNLCDEINTKWKARRANITSNIEGTNSKAIAWMIDQNNWNGVNRSEKNDNNNFYDFKDESLKNKIKYIIGRPFN